MDGYHNKQRRDGIKGKWIQKAAFGVQQLMEYKLRCGRRKRRRKGKFGRGTGWGTYLVEKVRSKKVEESTVKGRGRAQKRAERAEVRERREKVG